MNDGESLKTCREEIIWWRCTLPAAWGEAQLLKSAREWPEQTEGSHSPVGPLNDRFSSKPSLASVPRQSLSEKLDCVCCARQTGKPTTLMLFNVVSNVLALTYIPHALFQRRL